MSKSPPEEVSAFLSFNDQLREEALRILRVLSLPGWSALLRFFAPGPRGGLILGFLRPDCGHAGRRGRRQYEHDSVFGPKHYPECYEPIECFIDYADPDTGELFPFYPVDPILNRRQLFALLRLTNYSFNDVAPDIEGRLPCWCVCAATGPFVRQLFADIDNPWPTKEDRRWMRQERKAGMRQPRRHGCGITCSKHRHPRK